MIAKNSGLHLAILWLLLLSVQSVGLANEKIIFTEADGNVFLQRILVPRTQFTFGALEERFRKSIALYGKSHRIIKIEVLTDKKEAEGGNCKCATDVTYEFWAKLYENYQTKVPALAELFFMNGDGVMRVRDSEGKLRRKVLTETDPLKFKTEHYQFEIIHFARSIRNDGKTALYFFLIGRYPLTEDNAREATQALASRLQSDDLSVHIRLDPWFITNDLFPVVYVFQNNRAPPSESEHQQSSQVGCWLSGKKMYCK